MHSLIDFLTLIHRRTSPEMIMSNILFFLCLMIRKHDFDFEKTLNIKCPKEENKVIAMVNTRLTVSSLTLYSEKQ